MFWDIPLLVFFCDWCAFCIFFVLAGGDGVVEVVMVIIIEARAQVPTVIHLITKEPKNDYSPCPSVHQTVSPSLY